MHKKTIYGVVALIIGTLPFLYFLYAYLERKEDETFEHEYDIMSQGLITTMSTTIQHAKSGADQVSQLYSIAFPNESAWPNVFMSMTDFVESTLPVRDITGVNPFVCHFVSPSQVDSFEKFMQQAYEEDPVTRNQSVGVSDFGFGIFAFNYSDPSDTTPPSYPRYHDTTGETSISNRSLIAAVTQTALYPVAASQYMKNLHSEPLRGEAIDSVYECAQTGSKSCAALTDMFVPPFRFRPAFAATYTSLYFSGVFAGNGTLVGVMASPIRWILLIIAGVPEEQIADVIFSISTPLTTFTAHVIDGEAVEVLDIQHKNFEREVSLSSESDAVQYTLRLYPSPAYYDERHTLLPLITTIVTGVAIVLLLSLVVLNALFLTMQLERNVSHKLLESKAMFIRVISHELRSPLQSLKLDLELLQTELTPRGAEPPPLDVHTLTEIHDDIASNTDMAVSTLDDLLEYDKLKSGSVSASEEVLLVGVLLDVLAPFKQLAVRRQIRLSVQYDTPSQEGSAPESDVENLRVWADAHRLQRVFYHIMANTLKFIPDGSAISILLSWRHGGEAFCVSHLGSGERRVPKELHERSVLVCFETSGVAVAGVEQNFLLQPDLPFDPDMLQVGQGSGLGLCMSKMITEDHGGTMWMTAAEDKTGASIKVELPLVEPKMRTSVPGKLSRIFSEKDVEAAVSINRHLEIRHEITLRSPSASMAAESTRNVSLFSSSSVRPALRKVLVVDDSPPIRRLLYRVLTKKGACVEVACHGQEAVDMMSAAGRDFGCVLMDFEMPVLKGPDATQKIREMGFDSATLRIVGVTGNTNAEDVAHFKACGADDVYSKPVSADVLEKLLLSTHCIVGE